jgi:hypothetical protein
MDIAQNLCTGADQYAIAYFRMAVALVLASATQGHRLQNGDVIAHHRGLADNQSGGVIQHNAIAHAGCGVNVYSKFAGHAVLEEQGERFPSLLPQPVGNSMGLQGVKSLEIEEGDGEFVAG